MTLSGAADGVAKDPDEAKVLKERPETIVPVSWGRL